MDRSKKIAGVIYILTNPSFPDYVKIGYAADIEKRLTQLNRSECMPFAFRVYATYQVDTPLQDKRLHSIIDRLNPELRAIDTFDGKTRTKEFYAMTAEDAYSLLESIATLSGTLDQLQRLTPEGHEILDEETAKEIQTEVKERRAPFSFLACGIPIGSTICFTEDTSITATVKDDRHILYHKETTSLSALAQSLNGVDHPIQGTLYFTYNGKRLTDIREELELSHWPSFLHYKVSRNQVRQASLYDQPILSEHNSGCHVLTLQLSHQSYHQIIVLHQSP